MTIEAIEGLRLVKAQLDETLESLSPEEWELDSACAGWRIRDVVSHLGASAREIIDPEPAPADEAPMPEVRERQHDVLVNRRRSRPVDDIFQEYKTFSAQLVEMQVGLQEEPMASTEVPVPGLGTYPMHAIANALAFDYYCHLHHDILQPHGSLVRPELERSDVAARAAVHWMMLGLPQMQGDELADALVEPLTFDLTGPGHCVWTVTRPEATGPLIVTEGPGANTTIYSESHWFIAWGTKRIDWRAEVFIDGDQKAAGDFLDALNII